MDKDKTVLIPIPAQLHRRLRQVRANILKREGIRTNIGTALYFIMEENSTLHRQVVDLEEKLANALARINRLKQRLKEARSG
jgi:hypothetical protein